MRDKLLESKILKAECFELVQVVTKHFWSRWAAEIMPDQMLRKKWHETGCNLKVGDILLVHDKTPIKGHYLMTIVEAVSAGKNNLVQSCKVGYGIPHNMKDVA